MNEELKRKLYQFDHILTLSLDNIRSGDHQLAQDRLKSAQRGFRDLLLEQLKDGTTTARGKKPTDYMLWHRPKHGTPFLLDWGTEEAMKAKLAEMVIEPPAISPATPAPASA